MKYLVMASTAISELRSRGVDLQERWDYINILAWQGDCAKEFQQIAEDPDTESAAYIQGWQDRVEQEIDGELLPRTLPPFPTDSKEEAAFNAGWRAVEELLREWEE